MEVSFVGRFLKFLKYPPAHPLGLYLKPLEMKRFKLHNQLDYIQWHHAKISPKLSTFTPWETCLQTPLDSDVAYFAPPRLIFRPH